MSRLPPNVKGPCECHSALGCTADGHDDKGDCERYATVTLYTRGPKRILLCDACAENKRFDKAMRFRGGRRGNKQGARA